jgi:hypothetical protein
MTITHFFVSVICGGVVVVKLIVVGNIELKVRVVIRLGVGIVRRPTPPDRKLDAWGPPAAALASGEAALPRPFPR